mgnify:CR=1 FL=1
MSRPNTQPRGGQQALGDERSLTDVMQSVHEKSERVRMAMFDLQMEAEMLTRKLIDAQVSLFGRTPGQAVARYNPQHPVHQPPGGRPDEQPFRGEGEPHVTALAEKFAATQKLGARQSQ